MRNGLKCVKRARARKIPAHVVCVETVCTHTCRISHGNLKSEKSRRTPPCAGPAPPARGPRAVAGRRSRRAEQTPPHTEARRVSGSLCARGRLCIASSERCVRASVCVCGCEAVCERGPERLLNHFFLKHERENNTPTSTYLHPSTASHIDCSPGAPVVSHAGSHSPPPAGVTDQARKP